MPIWSESPSVSDDGIAVETEDLPPESPPTSHIMDQMFEGVDDNSFDMLAQFSQIAEFSGSLVSVVKATKGVFNTFRKANEKQSTGAKESDASASASAPGIDLDMFAQLGGLANFSQELFSTVGTIKEIFSRSGSAGEKGSEKKKESDDEPEPTGPLDMLKQLGGLAKFAQDLSVAYGTVKDVINTAGSANANEKGSKAKQEAAASGSGDLANEKDSKGKKETVASGLGGFNWGNLAQLAGIVGLPANLFSADIFSSAAEVLNLLGSAEKSELNLFMQFSGLGDLSEELFETVKAAKKMFDSAEVKRGDFGSLLSYALDMMKQNKLNLKDINFGILNRLISNFSLAPVVSKIEEVQKLIHSNEIKNAIGELVVALEQRVQRERKAAKKSLPTCPQPKPIDMLLQKNPFAAYENADVNITEKVLLAVREIQLFIPEVSKLFDLVTAKQPKASTDPAKDEL